MSNKKIALLIFALVGIISTAGVFLYKPADTTPSGGYRNIVDMESSYNADKEIAQAMQEIKSSGEKATVIVHKNSNERVIALTFDGLTDRTTIRKLLNLLKKYDSKATFFIDGMQAAEDPQVVLEIKQNGHRIENYSLAGVPRMERFSEERLVRDFCRSIKVVKVTADQGPNLLKCNDTQYTDTVLRAAKASGFSSVVKSDSLFNVKQIKTAQAAEAFVGSVKPGSIISVKLKPSQEAISKEEGKTDLRPAVDKQPGLKVLPPIDNSGETEVIDSIERFLTALQKNNYKTVFVEEFSVKSISGKTALVLPFEIQIKGVFDFWSKAISFLEEETIALFRCRTVYAAGAADDKAQEFKFIPTTEQALSYTFGGLAKPAAVDFVLDKLNQLGIRGTFFIAEVEMRRYPETVKKIIRNGHEIGIIIRPKEGDTSDEIYRLILRDRTMLKEQFGVTTNLVKQPWGVISDAAREAVYRQDCKLIGQSVNIVQTKHKDYTSAEQVMREVFRPSMISLDRGEILFFRMDYYTNEQLTGELLEFVKRQKIDNIAYATSYDNPAANLANNSQYVIRPVGEVLNNSKYTYSFPVEPSRVTAALRYDGVNPDKAYGSFITEASHRYIGNEQIDYDDRTAGFSKMELRRLDMSGMIHTKENILFLTFDDWGTDAAVNKLLYVLRKHQVPATFFVLTHNVMNNPNLLRSIAQEGHDIGSHSDNHKAMVSKDTKTGKPFATQKKEDYRSEMITSYQKLRSIVGDVVVNGKPSLTRFFRPPTMAISKTGMEALFEAGFEYIINGDSVAYDYLATSVPQLVHTIKDSIYTKEGKLKKGSILIMHMGDSCSYTPLALDILLTANEAKADSDPSKFKVGKLSDYLKDGYSQKRRPETQMPAN